VYYSATAVAQFVNPLPGILLIWAAPRQLIWYNLAFVIPSLINSTLVYNWWSRAKSGNENAWVKAIQGESAHFKHMPHEAVPVAHPCCPSIAFAHLSAIKDKMLGTSLAWVPSGDSRAHKSTKYRNMRRTAIIWTAAMQISLFVGMGVRIPQGLTGWYNFMPMLAVNFLNVSIQDLGTSDR
jgi:4-amino-4-deoxy-L-arabinose transferase-like glycosyltransferase